MCGIAGRVTITADPASSRVVGDMLARLIHRGPDDEGIASRGRAVLGTRRLSVIDLAGGHQPISGEDGRVTVAHNGEIYNYQELRSELAALGHHFTTSSDTEVIPHAYEEWGSECFSRLRGMFAIALWDAERETLVLARDRVGKKPLFFAQLRDEFLFASEIQALLAAGVPREVDDDAIAEYLAFGYVPAPHSAFRPIRKVKPGHVLIHELGSSTTRAYWRPRWEPKRAVSFAEATELFRAEFTEAVRLRLIADVPLGVLLSGGMDSSSIVAVAAKLSATRLQTFSIGFDDRAFDELRYARMVAEKFGTEHHELIVRPDASRILPDLVRHFGEPFADSSAIPTYWVSKTAREHVTVALNGDGGDELFGGYLRYRGVALAGWLDRFSPIATGLQRLGDWLPRAVTKQRTLARGLRFLRVASADPDVRYYNWIGYFAGSRRRQVGNDGDERAFVEQLRAAADESYARDPIERAMAADLLTYLPGDLLPKMDISAMANSLETRSPFLDHHVIELVASLPRSYKLTTTSSKRLLRSAMRGILPDPILRRSKMGFGVPVGSWLRNELRALLTDTLLASGSNVSRYLERSAVRALVEEHLEARADHTAYVWCLLMLELWFRECATANFVAPAHSLSQS